MSQGQNSTEQQLGVGRDAHDEHKEHIMDASFIKLHILKIILKIILFFESRESAGSSILTYFI